MQLDASLVDHRAEQAARASSRRCTTPRAGRRSGEFVADREERLFHVGRLDAETEGLMLLTNDGDLAHRLVAPVATACRRCTSSRSRAGDAAIVGTRLSEGVELEDGLAKVDSVPDRADDSAGKHGGDRAARGPQPDRATDARRGRAPGHAAGPHAVRADPPRATSSRARTRVLVKAEVGLPACHGWACDAGDARAGAHRRHRPARHAASGLALRRARRRRRPRTTRRRPPSRSRGTSAPAGPPRPRRRRADLVVVAAPPDVTADVVARRARGRTRTPSSPTSRA